MGKAIRLRLALFIAISFLPSFACADERWKIQYFYDKADSSLNIRDLQCPSPTHCVAAGSIEDKKAHAKGTVVWTGDGGKNWSLEEVNEQPISLFFLNDTMGWMVAEHGLWSTVDGGRTWKKLENKKGILEAYFLNTQHGYELGYPKAVYETIDGGRKWTRLAAADQAALPQDTVYECISFFGLHGVIVGNAASQYDEAEVWLNPAQARFHRERIATIVMLETSDGGANWVTHKASLRGKLTQFVMTGKDAALALFEYHNYYALPSRVYKMTFPGGMESVFAESDRAATDIALLPGGEALLAAVEPPGASNQVPIPGKLKILKSSNLKVWEEMDVDYRAVAQRAMLAAPDAQHVWVATDTGMILTLDTAGATFPNPARKP